MLTQQERHELTLLAKRTGSPEAAEAAARLYQDERDARVQEIASEYMARNLHVIAIEPRGKQPIGRWSEDNIKPEELDSFFGKTDHNVGIALGIKSGGLCDYDLDWPISAVVADFIISTLPAFGRSGKPRSHRLFKCSDSGGLKQFILPDSLNGDPRLPGEHAMCVCEVRGNGCYTVVPPSTHASEQRIEWESGHFQAPLDNLQWSDAVGFGGMIAFLSFAAQFYPGDGMRNRYTLALGGALVRAMMPAYKDDESGLCKWVDNAVQVVCKIAGDKGRGSSWTDRARNTLARIKSGEPAWGLTEMCSIVGVDDAVKRRLCEWLGMTDSDDRPIVLYDELKLNSVIITTEKALLNTDSPIYQSAGRLIRPTRFDAPKYVEGVVRAPGSMVQLPINKSWLHGQLLEAVNWRLLVNDKKTGAPKQVKRPPPRSLAEDYLARAGEWNVPVLNGFAQTPIITSEGRLVTTEGYDTRSGLLLDFCGVQFPTIDDKPTKEDARRALDGLIEVIHEFPFVLDDEEAKPSGDAPSGSRSVALSTLLTAVCRRAMRTAPVHGVRAPAMLTGKTLLVDTAAVIATGKHAPVLTLGADIEEDEKRLVGMLLNGDPIINIDNVGQNRMVEGDFFNTILSSDDVSVRMLGSTGQHRVRTNTLFTINGNNLVFSQDMTARALLCRLDSQREDPGSRIFEKDLRQWVPDNRPRLVGLALTVLRAYAAAGYPIEGSYKRWGRFEDWEKMVRSALLWLGEPDPCTTREEVKQNDPAAEMRFGLMRMFIEGAEHGLEVNKLFTPQSVIEKAMSYPALHTTLEATLGPRITSMGLGRYLSKCVGNITRGYSFVKRTINGMAMYKLQPATGADAPTITAETSGAANYDDDGEFYNDEQVQGGLNLTGAYLP